MWKGGEMVMGLTERHWFENEDVPENYEWALEDAVYDKNVSIPKKYEPVKPDYSPYYQEWYCGNCGKMIPRAYNYCGYCGQAVKWE